VGKYQSRVHNAKEFYVVNSGPTRTVDIQRMIKTDSKEKNGGEDEKIVAARYTHGCPEEGPI